MASGKLVLFLVAGGLAAGLGLAGMTTHGMRSFRVDQAFRADHGPAGLHGSASREQATVGYDAGEPHARSWLEERFSELDLPAWPFGRSQWQDNSPPPDQDPGYAPPDGYEPNSYGPNDYGRDGSSEYEDGRDTYADTGAYEPELSGSERLEPGTSAEPAAPRNTSHARQNDTAADAAARAGAAAQDVIAAERPGT